MAEQTLQTVLQQVRKVAAVQTGRGLGDRELLARFVGAQDEAAFTVLVERHGPMVLGVCRRALGNAHDAEDALQATFMVLARKAVSIRQTASLGSWLHRVAGSVAANLRRERSRRWRRERAAPSRVPPDPAIEVNWREVQTALDEELQRLPERYRGPLILCYLDGQPRDEAARQLGLSLGALRGLLDRGRRLLCDRLTRRGLTLSAAFLAAALAENTAPAALSPLLVLALTRAALRFAFGKPLAGAAASTNVVSLAQEVLRSMSLTKLKLHTALVLAAGLLLTGIGGALSPARSLQEGKPPSKPAGEAAAARVGVVEGDADGDGLTDFQERHKYRTDPNKKDTAGQGVSDGDWQQRREFTYSVRAILRVMPPYNLKAITDDYQDVRVLTETKDYAELEVVAYPLNTNAQAIQASPNWKKDYAGMKEYLAPGITTNWDDAMRQELLRELAKAGIDPDKLTDKEVVEKVSRWLFQHCKYRYMFCTFYLGFAGGKPAVLPGLETAFEREKGDQGWTVQQQLEHELFGKQMFANRSVGTCTSAAVLQTTVLRALGIPTRMILCIPLADGSDPTQVDLVDKGLTNHRVRYDACLGALSGGSGFTSHTFCEVFVGGRWRRLNSTTLGQNILERNYLGLMIHVHTFKDLSDANLAATWGTRYGKGQRDTAFPYSNPYRLLEVSDHFGKYANVPNPPVDREHKRVTISKAYWPDTNDVPAAMRDLRWGKEPGTGRFFVHCVEWFEGAGDYLQYKLFMRRADRRLVLRAKGQRDVACQISMNFYTNHSENLCELEVVIPAAEYAKMAKAVAYTLHPVNGKQGFEWQVRDGLTVTRE
jgi:RNA polymerase sigma factor (sigma-70 family)